MNLSHDGKPVKKMVSADGARMAILRPYKRPQADGRYDVIYAWQCRFKGRIVIGGVSDNTAVQYVTDADRMGYKVVGG